MKYKKEWLGKLGFCDCWKFGPFKIMVGNEPNIGWHLSISHKSRYPLWDDIKAAKYEFLPDIPMFMDFPPSQEYINLHPNCFHLWEKK